MYKNRNTTEVGLWFGGAPLLVCTLQVVVQLELWRWRTVIELLKNTVEIRVGIYRLRQEEKAL